MTLSTQHLPTKPVDRCSNRSARLPAHAHASKGLPGAEIAVFIAVVPLLSAPVLLATMGAAWALALGIALTATIAWLCLARRVVIGQGWLADRRLWRYRITKHSGLRAAQWVDTAHGGLLQLHLHGGRPYRVRATDLASPPIRIALADLIKQSEVDLGPEVRRALSSATERIAAGSKVIP